MDRTTIILPPRLKLKLKQRAQKEHISFGELVRRAVERYLLWQDDPYKHDSFFSSNLQVDVTPSDMSENVDEALYEEADPHE